MFKYRSGNKIKGTFILQQSPSDSGVACLASIINYHNGDFSLNTIRELSSADTESPTLLGLYHAAHQLGYDAEGLQANSAKDLVDFNDVAILHVIIRNSKHRFLVFYGYKNGHLIIGDPAKGIVNYTFEALDKIWQSKSLLKLRPNENFVKRKVEKGQKKKFLFDLIKNDLPILMFTVLLSVAIPLLSFFSVLYLEDFIDKILPERNHENIAKVILVSASCSIVGIVLGYIKNIFNAKQIMNFNNRLVNKFYNRLLRLPRSFFDLRHGEFLTHKNDVRLLQSSMGIITNNVFADTLRTIVFFSIAFVYAPSIGLLALISIPIHFIMQYVFNGKLVRLQKKIMANRALAETHYVESVNSITTIKALVKEDFFGSVHNNVFDAFQKKLFQINKLNSQFAFFSKLVSLILVFAICGLLLQTTLIKTIAFGEMVMLLFIAGSLVHAVYKLTSANSTIQEARLAFNRLHDFITVKSENYNAGSFPSGPDERSFFKEDFRMKFKDISFRFPGRKKLLRNISLKVKRGEIIALLGESGSGKTTIIQILQKFYKPKSGKIEVNSVDLAKIQVTPWRNIVSVVPQEIKIFNSTLLYNLTLSDKPDDMDEVMEFCQYYGFDRYFELFPQSYVTMLGSEGVNISGAQKQLVGLARALYRKPELLLLDEAITSMDSKMEKFVFDLLGRLKSTMATIIVTNRATIAQKTDRIYLLEKGELSNSESPMTLMLTENIFSGSIKSLMN